MSANTNQLLKELKNIKTANENLTILNNNLLVIERQKEEKDSMAKKKARDAAKVVYNEKKREIVKTPFPSIAITGKDAPPACMPEYVGKYSIECAMREQGESKTYPLKYLVSLIIRCGIIVSLPLAVVGMVIGSVSFSMIGYWALVIFGIAWLFFFRKAKEVNEVLQKAKEHVDRHREYEESKAKWEKATEEYVDGLDTEHYKEAVEKVFPQAKKFREEFLVFTSAYDLAVQPILAEYKNTLQENEKEYQRKRDKINQDLDFNTNYLNAVTLIHPSMFGRIDEIYAALELGRADSIKDAINIVLDDERRAREESQRQAEAQRQEALMKKQADEARRQREAEERRANEAQAQADAALKDRQNAARRRCRDCVHGGSCSMTVRLSFGETGDVCPSYKPR